MDHAASSFALEIRGLAKHFERPAVDGLDLTVRASELYTLLGPNGAGKTTTIGRGNSQSFASRRLRSLVDRRDTGHPRPLRSQYSRVGVGLLRSDVAAKKLHYPS